MTPAELLERTQWDLFWVPRDAAVHERPDLLAVTCPRPVGYLNVVLRARGDVERHLADVEALPSGRPVRWMVTDTWNAAPLTRVLAHQGYRRGAEHEVRVLPVDRWDRAPTLETRPVADLPGLRDAVAVAAAAFGTPDASTEDSLGVDLRACTEGGRVHRFVAYDRDGAPVASGGLTAFPALSFGLLWAGGVVPGARGRGAYTSVLAARIARAGALGLRWVGLYALAGTSAPIVARFGFGDHGRMAFWERPTE